jgi:hypothetical protein
MSSGYIGKLRHAIEGGLARFCSYDHLASGHDVEIP